MAKLPHTAHTSRPWRIHELTPDFRLEDVWALPTPGDPDDFPRLVHAVVAGDPLRSPSPVVRALFGVRQKLGELLGWDKDDKEDTDDRKRTTLRDRLPADLRDAPAGPAFDSVPFTTLYMLDDEFAAELDNRTVHGVIHLGWVPDSVDGGDGHYRGQLAILVKRHGLLGTAYMAAIKPFRYLLVYPLILRQLERTWRAGAHAEARPTPRT